MLFYGLFRLVLTYSCLYKIYILVCLRFLPEDRMSRRRRSFRRSRRGISPVISTIIIVAVAIAISIAVAFWLGGITSIFTRFEKLEITSAYATASGSDTWKIVLTVKNTGTTATTITDIFINNIPISDYNGQISADGDNGDNHVKFNDESQDTQGIDQINYPLDTGEDVTITFYLKSDTAHTFTHGQSVTITIHTAGGQDYPQTVVLP